MDLPPVLRAIIVAYTAEFKLYGFYNFAGETLYKNVWSLLCRFPHFFDILRDDPECVVWDTAIPYPIAIVDPTARLDWHVLSQGHNFTQLMQIGMMHIFIIASNAGREALRTRDFENIICGMFCGPNARNPGDPYVVVTLTTHSAISNANKQTMERMDCYLENTNNAHLSCMMAADSHSRGVSSAWMEIERVIPASIRAVLSPSTHQR